MHTHFQEAPALQFTSFIFGVILITIKAYIEKHSNKKTSK